MTGNVDVTADGRARPAGRVRRRPSGEPPPLPKEITPARRYWIAAFAGWAVLWLLVLSDIDIGRAITRGELWLMEPLIEHRTAWLDSVTRGVQEIGLHWCIPIVGWLGLLVLVATRRVRHVAIFMVALLLTGGLVLLIRVALYRPRPVGFEILGEWQGYSHPSGPSARLAALLVVVILATVPKGRWRLIAFWAAGIFLACFAFSQVYLAVEHPTDPLVGITIGVTIATVLLGLFAPESSFPIEYRRGRSAHVDVGGVRGDAIRHAVEDQLGLEVVDLERIGLEGSAGSTPLALHVRDRRSGVDRRVFAKLYTQTHLRSDRWYKLARTLLYGRLENEQSFRSVRHLAEYEDYMLRLMQDEGVSTPQPLGIVELTPEREYLICTEFLTDAREIGDEDVIVGDAVVDAALRVVRSLWDAGIAHRDVKPANVMVRAEQVYLIDVAFAQVRPSPWRQAIDLANMMLVLALRCSPALVYQRATLQFSEDEIAEAFAASRGVTLPTQVRTQVREHGRDLLGIFRSLAPDREPIRIQRFTWRRIGLLLGVLVGGLVILVAFLANLAGLGLI